jgi:hypothetical protein
MSDQEIRDMVAKAIKAVPGSSASITTRAPSHRRPAGDEGGAGRSQSQQPLLVDSRTSGQSIAADAAARRVCAPAATGYSSTAATKWIYQGPAKDGGRLAIRDGNAIAIGHARPARPRRAGDDPRLEAMGVKFVFVSQLVR